MVAAARRTAVATLRDVHLRCGPIARRWGVVVSPLERTCHLRRWRPVALVADRVLCMLECACKMPSLSGGIVQRGPRHLDADGGVTLVVDDVVLTKGPTQPVAELVDQLRQTMTEFAQPAE